MAYYLLGTAYYRAAAYAESEASLTRALQLERGMTQARLMFINLYSRQQKWESALDHIDAYLAENPKAAGRDQIQAIRSKITGNLKAAGGHRPPLQ
ncbi:MAG: hypothetical protein HYU27_02985, partial [Acidobacteria bacterium]|nr:hypothetical protein [Acidobacteriota bacterium]